MNNIVLHTKGGLIPLNSYNNVSAIQSASQSVELNGTDNISISLVSAKLIDIAVGDYIIVFGKTYILNQLPTIKKTSNRKFEYDLVFESVQYQLLDIIWLLKINQSTSADYPSDTYYANLEEFLENLCWNANRVYGEGTWSFKNCPQNTDYKNLTFDNNNCLEVLQSLCDEYKVNFRVDEENGKKIINIYSSDNENKKHSGYTFEYGQRGGVYELTRKNVDSKNVITRLYAFGSNKNLSSEYKEKNLCLPKVKGSLEHKTKSFSYIEASNDMVARFGVKENVKNFDDIFPNHTFKVEMLDTASQSKGEYNRFWTWLNFNLLEKKPNKTDTLYLINGTEAKVTFQNGNLGGYEFALLRSFVKTEFDKSNNKWKTYFALKKVEDENGFIRPNPDTRAFQFDVNDEFLLSGINMPNEYIIEAQDKLLEKATEYLDEYQTPHVEYSLSIDRNFMKSRIGTEVEIAPFQVGDFVSIKDNDLFGDEVKDVQITAIERDLIDEFSFEITLGESTSSSTLQRIIGDISNVKKKTEVLTATQIETERLQYQSNRELLNSVFDTEGETDDDGNPYFGNHIKPLSIETTMLSVGARSTAFTMSNFVFTPNEKLNLGASEDYWQRVSWSNAQLNHQAFNKTWNIADSNGVVVVPEYKQYYIYAKCEQDGNNGTIYLSTSQIPYNGNDDVESGFYYFLVGVLSSPQEMVYENKLNNVRFCNLTYGTTTINGSFLQTGRIQSNNGASYFDLDTGEFNGDFKFTNDNSAFNTQINGDLVVSKQIVVTNEQNKCAGLDGYSQSRAIYSGANWVASEGKGDANSSFEVSYSGEVSLINRSNSTPEYIRFTPTKMMGTIPLAVSAITGGSSKNTLYGNAPLQKTFSGNGSWNWTPHYNIVEGKYTASVEIKGSKTDFDYVLIGRVKKEGYLKLNRTAEGMSNKVISNIVVSNTKNCKFESYEKDKFMENTATMGVYYSITETGEKKWIGSFYDSNFFNIPSSYKNYYIWLGYGNMKASYRVRVSLSNVPGFEVNSSFSISATFTTNIEFGITAELVAEAAYNEITPDGIFLSKSSTQYIGMNARPQNSSIIFKAMATNIGIELNTSKFMYYPNTTGTTGGVMGSICLLNIYSTNSVAKTYNVPSGVVISDSSGGNGVHNITFTGCTKVVVLGLYNYNANTSAKCYGVTYNNDLSIAIKYFTETGSAVVGDVYVTILII